MSITYTKKDIHQLAVNRFRKMASDPPLCDFIIHYKDDGIIKFLSAPCHASLARLQTPSEIKAIYTSLYMSKTCSVEGAIKFWDYILDPRASPWRAALEGSEIIYTEEGVPCALKITKMDVAACLLGNLCIATRVPREHPGVVDMYNRCRDFHLTKAEALFLSAYYQISNSSIILSAIGHFPFSSYASVVSFTRIRDGNPAIDGRKLFSEGGRYHDGGCNAIWNSDTLKSVITMRKLLNPVNMDRIPYKGSFKKWFGRFKNLSLNARLDKLSFNTDGFFDIEKSIRAFKESREEWSKS